jgi:hypothetical protein
LQQKVCFRWEEIFVQHKRNITTHSGLCNRCSQIARSRPYQHLWNKALLSTKRRLNKLDIDSFIPYQEFVKLMVNDSCVYCKRRLLREPYENRGSGNSYLLDRKDNNRGYIIGNLVSCCWDCNVMKGNRFSYEEFILFAPILEKIWEQRNLA